MQLEIVTPDRRVVVEETADVVVPAREGEMEVLPGHAPLLAALGTGILSFKTPAKGGASAEVRLMVSGGFIDIDGERVTLMCEAAALADEVHKEVENKALFEAEKKLKELGVVAHDDENFQLKKAEVERAAAKLTLVR